MYPLSALIAIVTKKVEGEVDYNDGEFAEVKIIGIEGIENGHWLGSMQIHREKIEYTPDEFREQYPVGMLLQIVTTTEIRAVSQSPLDLSECLARIIHIFEDNKSLLCYKHVV